MLQYLYYQNPYLKSAKFKVLKVESNRILLNNTILYPGGGGQPADEGTAICGGRNFKIRHIGNLWHEIDGECTSEELQIDLNWERRYLLMRSHTAEHTFFRFLENMGARMGKINLGEESSIIFTGEIDVEDILQAERDTRRLIEEGRKVRAFWISREEIKDYPQLRIKIERIKEDAIRVIEIEGHDLSACKGVHIQNLSEIGDFAITWIRMGKKKEVKFVIGERAKNYHFRASQTLRRIMWKRNLSMESVEKYVENMEEESKKMLNALRELSKSREFSIDLCGDVEIYHQIFPYGDHKIIQRRAMELANHRDAVIIYAINNVVCMAFNPAHSWAREEYMNLIESMGGRGGGKGNFLSGSVPNPDEFTKILKNIICEKALQLHGDENGYS